MHEKLTVMTESHSSPYHTIPKERIANVIDAIYAFSMTLLVTTISIPPKYMQTTSPQPVHAIFASVLPDLLHYFIAFIILALFWYFEHQRFRHLTHLNRTLLFFTIASLSFVCLIPFTTNIAGDFPFDMFGAMLFELNIFILGVLILAQWFYIRSRARELVPSLDDSHIRREIQWAFVFPALAVAGFALAVIGLPGTSAFFLLAPFILAFLYWKDPEKNRQTKTGQ